MAKNSKVNLDLLKRLVGELESSLNTSEAIRVENIDVKDYIIEMSKAAGLAAGVMSEATALIGDIQYQIQQIQGPVSKEDPLTKILSLVKGGNGGLPGTN